MSSKLVKFLREHEIVIHETVRVKVWADIDAGIADMVLRLNDIPGVRTYASCQGTKDYAPYVMTSWPDEETLERLKAEFEYEDVDMLGSNTAHFHPREICTECGHTVTQERKASCPTCAYRTKAVVCE